MAPRTARAGQSAQDAMSSVIHGGIKKAPAEKKYICNFCDRAFSRSEHRSRHERSHTKERPFKCQKCKSTFVRRDLLLRHDRTVHARDGGPPLQSEARRRSGPRTAESQQEEEEAQTYTGGQEHHHLGQLDGMSAGMNQFNGLSHMDNGMAQMRSMNSMDNLTDELETHQTATILNEFHQKAMADSGINPHQQLDMSAMSGNDGSLLDEAGPYSMWAQEHLLSNPSTMDPHFLQSTDHHHNQAAFINPELAAGQSDHLPQMLPRHPSTDMGPFHQSTSLSGMDTPAALSPFPPSMVGPVSPVDYRRSPGASQGLTMTKAPQITTNEQCMSILESIKMCDTEIQLLETFRLPNMKDLNRQLSMYFGLFHHHSPFLHPDSFAPADVAAPLLLAVLSIGALYTFQQTQAYMLHVASKSLINQYLNATKDYSSRKCPLWTLQATLLNMIFASWSGDPKGLEWACSIKGFVATMVTGGRSELKLRMDAREGSDITHEEWIEDEECRRTYFAAYVFFGMQTLTYNYEPQIGFSELATLELPSSESAWNMGRDDEQAWRDYIARTKILTLREAYDALMSEEVACYSAFATRIMINLIFLHLWVHKRSPLQDIVTDFKIRHALDWWVKSLEVCEAETMIVNLPSTPDNGHPLIFNAKAVYRNTRARLVVDLKAIQEALRYHDSYEVAAAMTNSKTLVHRSSEMLGVIQECYDCVRIAAKQGLRWVARTSATSWSIEQPLCGLDLIVILTLWLYRIDNDEEAPTIEEKEMYQKVQTLFGTDVGSDGLSAVVARLWGSMIDEVVVWGIARLIGEAFKHHALALDTGNGDEHEGSLHDHSAVAASGHQALELQSGY